MNRTFSTEIERQAYAQGVKDAQAQEQPPLTMDDVRKMSQAEMVRRMDEVKEVMRQGAKDAA